MATSHDRIKDLLQTWSNHKTSPQQEQEILDWINENGDQGPVQTHIEQLVQNAGPSFVVDWENLYEKILAQRPINNLPEAEKPIPRIGRRNKSWWMAAAAIIILAVSIGLYLQNNAPPKNIVKEKPNQDAAPGRNGAVLTLAGGKQVVLDNLGNGIVTTQGKTTVSIQNGQLVYDANSTGKDILYNTMTTPKGRQFQLVLPDGSKVWLNAASTITYPTVFAGKERKVTISGEAYFEIAKDKTKPFRVNVEDRSLVEVVGTHFNINSFADDGNIKTTLLEGSVKVAASLQQVMLKPGEQAIQSQQASNITVNINTDIEQVMAWKNGLFNFNHADLKTVMQQLSRWYDMEVKYETDIPARTFRGKITRDLNLSQVLKLLEDVGVKFRIDGKTLIVTQ